MRRPLPPNGIIVSSALVAALLLTVFRQSPEGLFTFGVGEREARAAPGAPANAALKRKKHNLTALKVFNLALVRVRDAYVDARRIDPRKMMFAALDSVQLNVPEVLIEPYPERDQVVVVVNDKNQTFSTKDVDSPWRLSGKLKDVFRFIQANMNPGADLAQVEYSAVNGMLSTLDPHSVLLDPEAANEMDVSTNGYFGGLGIVIGMRKGKLTVIRPMPGTPAFRAGIKANDYIFRINSEATDHLTLNGAVSRMRGKEGTKVTIWVKRKATNADLRFDLVRARIRVVSVESQYLDTHHVGYLKIKNFQQSTAREVRNEMNKLRQQGATSWVLDLRRNPGGLLEQAIQVADLFVDRGTIVTTVGGKERDARRATRKGTDKTAPVVVLVDGQSASASEIVAGALKNLDRAVVVGTPTFGKGSVQILYENKDGSKLKLTIAEYLTPGDISIQSVGVPPDIELARMHVPKQVKGPKDRVRLLRTRHVFRESDLDAHLTSKHAKAAAGAAETVKFLYEPPKGATPVAEVDPEEPGLLPEEGVEDPFEEEIAESDGFVEDFEVRFARDLAAMAKTANRSRVLKDAKRFLGKRRLEEQKRVRSALADLNIDWTTPAERTASSADLKATIEVVQADGTPLADHTVRAGQTVRIRGTVTNSGTGPAYQVHAQANGDDRVFDEAELVFGRVDPGQSRSFQAWINVPQSALDRVVPLRFAFSEFNGAPVAAKPVRLRVIAHDRPLFAYSHQLIDDEGNGDGLVQIGEKTKLLVTFKNIGAGRAHEVTAILSNRSGGNLDGIVINKGRYQFSEGIKPGEEKTVEFAFSTNDLFDKPELVLELSVYDPILSEAVTEKLKYPIRPNSAGPKQLSGAIKVAKPNVALLEGAAADAGSVASARRGVVLPLTGAENGFYRVALADGRPAFIAASSGRVLGRAGQPGQVRMLWQATPPKLSLDLPALESSHDRYTLRGQAVDDVYVEDIYIFVSNREAKIDNKKVFYKSNRGNKDPTQLSFRHDLPLWPGSNLIAVVVRGRHEVQTTRYLYIHRNTEPEQTAARH
jgi:carboxyl-terminal processing protease